uniref:ORF28/29 n=1 Tax=Cydia pomonella granulosis virus TaxID=28289 RepID=A0A097P264_GVCP|nr:ORF28/29 [Cydia pomonella granulovirus]
MTSRRVMEDNLDTVHKYIEEHHFACREDLVNTDHHFLYKLINVFKFHNLKDYVKCTRTLRELLEAVSRLQYRYSEERLTITHSPRASLITRKRHTDSSILNEQAITFLENWGETYKRFKPTPETFIAPPSPPPPEPTYEPSYNPDDYCPAGVMDASCYDFSRALDPADIPPMPTPIHITFPSTPLAPLQRCISPMSPCRSRSASPLQFPEPNHERTPSSTPQLQSRSQSPATPINQRIKQLTTPPRLEPNRRRAEYESMRRSTSSLRRSTPSLRRPTSTPRSLSASSADTNQSRSRSAVRDPSSDSEDSDDEEEEKKQDSDNEDKKPTNEKSKSPANKRTRRSTTRRIRRRAVVLLRDRRYKLKITCKWGTLSYLRNKHKDDKFALTMVEKDDNNINPAELKRNWDKVRTKIVKKFKRTKKESARSLECDTKDYREIIKLIEGSFEEHGFCTTDKL